MSAIPEAKRGLDRSLCRKERKYRDDDEEAEVDDDDEEEEEDDAGRCCGLRVFAGVRDCPRRSYVRLVSPAALRGHVLRCDFHCVMRAICFAEPTNA